MRDGRRRETGAYVMVALPQPPASLARVEEAPVRFGCRLAAAAGAVALLACLWTVVGLNDMRRTGCEAALVAVLAVHSLRERRGRQVADAKIAAFAAEQDRSRLLVANTSDVIFAFDRDGVARFVSPSSLSLLGYTAEELLGTRATDLVHPEDLPEHLANISTLFAGDHDHIVTTHRCRRRDGSHIWTEATYRVVLDPVTRQPSGCTVFYRDVSQRHAAEAALREGEALLRSVIDSSPDCLEVLDLDGDVAFISRNGLCWLGSEEADVIGHNFAEMWPAVDRPKVLSAVAAAASGALTRFTASPLTGSGRTLHVDVCVTPIVGSDGTIARLLAISRDTTRATEAETALRQTQTSYGLLSEHLSEVVMASQAGPHGRRLYVSPSCGRMLGYEAETGAIELKPLAFEPEASAAPNGTTLSARRTGRILLVEDSDVNQRLAFALLDLRGHSVDIVADGAEAVAAVAERAYDLVFMDVRMSGMDGITATRLIRDAGGLSSKVPIIAMTADVYPEQIDAFKRAGMDDHIGKPLRWAQLYATVDRWLKLAVPAVDDSSREVGGGGEHATGQAFDTEAFDRLLSFIGKDKLDDILSRFEASLPWRFGTGDGSPEALRRWTADAHVVLSVAGMTGFGQLATACRALQGASPGTEHQRSSLDAARAARDTALLALADLRQSLAAAVE